MKALFIVLVIFETQLCYLKSCVLIMGAFLKSIQSQKYQKPDFLQFFSNNSLTKLSEYYASFRSMSQTYSIDNQQFAELFGHSYPKLQQLFECLDSDHNLLIDGLQLFTGLALLSSNIQFKQKIIFVFQMFDFNSLRSLSRTDIEFMVISACNIVSKIYKIVHQESFVQEFIRQEFQNDQRVNISQVLRWTCKSPKVANFFKLIGYPSDNDSGPMISHKIYLTLPQTSTISKAVSQRVQTQQQAFISKTYKLFKELQQQEEEQLLSKINEIVPQTSWVYGIRFKDTKQFIEVQGKQMIYYVGKIVVLYNRMSRKQRHYLGHKQQIISLVKSNEFLMGSGEYGKQPEIKVWNRKSLQTVVSLKGHSQGVHLLQFVDDLLVSCGCSPQSPLLIHSIQTGNTIFSTYTPWPAVDICSIENFTNKPCKEFVVGSLYGIDHFQLQKSQDGKMSIKVTKLRDNEISKIRLTCVCFFLINATFQQLKQYDERVQKHLLAGYQNGEIVLWNLNKCQRQLVFSSQGYEILGIIPTHNYLYVVTNSTFIISYDIAVLQRQKLTIIDFTQIDQEISSYDLVNVKYTKEGLLLITQNADLIILNPYQPISRPNLSYFQLQLYPAIKIPDILYFQYPISAQKMVKKENESILFISEGHRVKGIDLNKHSFVREWNVGQQVTAFDVISIRNMSWLLVAGVKRNSENSYLCSQIDFSESNYRQEVSGEITSICLHSQQNSSYVIILVSTRDAIYKYNYSKGTFVKSTFLSLPQYYSRLTFMDSNKFLISNKNNIFQVITANKQQYQLHAQAVQQRSITTFIPIKLYFCLGNWNNESLINIVGRKVKCLVITRLNGNIDVFNSYEDLYNLKPVTLLGHNSSIADIGLSDDQKKLISSGKSDGMIIEWSLKVAGQKKSAIKSLSTYKEKYRGQKREDFANKLEFCRFNNSILNDSYDQHLIVAGLKNENIRRLFKASLNEWKNTTQSNEPSLGLTLDYAFGIETTHKNQTLLVLQSRKIMYFIGKIIVIYHIQSNSQQFYRGHKFRVTCFSLLPNKDRVASGQASYHPIINIWCVATLETLLIIQTDHIGGIIDLAVEGNIILSFGYREKTHDEETETNQYLYSFQVYDYEHNQVLAYRPEKDFAYAIAIDPTNHLRYVTCNEGGVSFWQVSANRISRRSFCSINQDTATACVYYSGPKPAKSDPDLIVGTLSGAVGVVSREKHWWVFCPKENQSKQINCLLLASRKQQTLIFASSDDSNLRWWNQSFVQDSKYNLLKQDEEYRKTSENRSKEEYNRSLQSLCLIDPKNLKMIGATRNGQIVQLEINSGDKGNQTVQSLITRFSGGFGQKGTGKVLISHHPRFDILATLGQDHVVIFWNCQQGRILHTRQLGLDSQKTQPTALKFSHNGDYLLAGFSDGLLLYLNSKMSKSMQGKGGDSKFSEPSLAVITKQKAEDNYAVVAIEFSQAGEFLAVSYHCLDSQKSIALVKISASKLKDNKQHRPNKFQDERMYETHWTVDNHHLEHAYSTGSGKNCGFAACNMSFAEYEGGHYLLMFFDLLDENQKRVWATQSEEGIKYKILHVNNKTDSSNSSSLNELIRWRKPHVHRALAAHYLFPSNIAQTSPANNHLRIPEFTNSVYLNGHLLLATQNGDLHLLRASSIQAAASIAKTLPAHGCIINQIQQNFNHSIVYTSGQNDHCVLKWIVEGTVTPQNQDQVFEQARDLFGEIPEPQELEKKLKNYDSKFKRMGISATIPGFIQQLKVKEIIGRTSYCQRNNLKVDSKGRVLYYTGQAIIAANLQTKSKEFLYLTDQRKIVQQVSAIQISQEGDIVVAAYSGRKAQIVIWALASKIIQSRMYLEDIVQIIYIKFSHDHSRLLIYGLRGMQAEGCLVLVDLNNKNILATATYLHKQSWHLKGLAFVPNSCDRFFTCGVQPVKSWFYHSGQLVYNTLHSKFEADALTIHTSLVFADQILITGTDNGQLVVWHNDPIPYAGHQSMMVNCLSAIKKSKDLILIASGSQSIQSSQPGQVLLWSFNKKDLKQLKRITAKCEIINFFDVGNGISSKSQSDLEVQSLVFHQNQLIIGLLKGDIFTYQFQLQQKGEIAKAKHIFCFQDSQRTQSLFFTNTHEYLIYISQHGLLRIWSFFDSLLVWSKNLKGEVVNMVYSNIHQLIIIAFHNQLRVFQWGADRKSLEEKKEQMMQFNSINLLAINHNQKRIALGYKNSSDKSQMIQLYSISDKELKPHLSLHLDCTLSYIDFSRLSTDRTIILVKTDKWIQLYDVTSDILANVFKIPAQNAKKIDWLGYGLELSEKTEKARIIHCQIAVEDVSICKIAEIGRSILIADSDGHIIKVTDGQLTGKCKLGMSGIDFVAISPSGKWCAVVSKQDRNIVILELLLDK